MNIKIDNKAFQVPTAIEDITIGQYVGFWQTYGETIREEIVALEANEDFLSREVETYLLHMQMACRHISHFTGIGLAKVESEVDIQQALNLYSIYKMISDDEINGSEIIKEFSVGGFNLKFNPPFTNQAGVSYGDLIFAHRVIPKFEKISKGDYSLIPEVVGEYYKCDEADSNQINELVSEASLKVWVGISEFIKVTLNTIVRQIEN